MDPFAKDIRKLLRRKYGMDTDRPPASPPSTRSSRPARPCRSPTTRRPTASSASARPENDFHTCDHRTQINGSVGLRHLRLRDERGGRRRPAHRARTLTAEAQAAEALGPIGLAADAAGARRRSRLSRPQARRKAQRAHCDSSSVIGNCAASSGVLAAAFTSSSRIRCTDSRKLHREVLHRLARRPGPRPPARR